MLTLFVIAVLIAFNAFYVAAEFAAVSVRRSRIRQMAEEGNALARDLLPIIENGKRLDRYIAACQVGITLSSLVLGAYGQASLGRLLSPLFERWGEMRTAAAESTSVVIVLIALTMLQMVLGELVPKSLALQSPTRVAIASVVPMRWSERLLAWFIAVLNGSGWAVLRLLRIRVAGHRHLHSPEEIRLLIAESRRGGHLRREEQRRLNHALGLTQRTARELMIPRIDVVALRAATPLEEAIGTVGESPYTRLPVYRDSLDGIIGLVHAKDLLLAQLAEHAPSSLEAITRPILAVHEHMTADRVLATMREQHGVMAIVVDDFGGTSGIVTAEDILSELLGEVADEFKHEEAGPEKLADGRVRLPGDLLLHETRRWVGVEWRGASDTVGGLVAERLGRLATPGDVLEIDGVEVEVIEVEHHAVQWVIARPVSGDGSGEEVP